MAEPQKYRQFHISGLMISCISDERRVTLRSILLYKGDFVVLISSPLNTHRVFIFFTMPKQKALKPLSPSLYQKVVLVSSVLRLP